MQFIDYYIWNGNEYRMQLQTKTNIALNLPNVGEHIDTSQYVKSGMFRHLYGTTMFRVLYVVHRISTEGFFENHTIGLYLVPDDLTKEKVEYRDN